ncbi:MAG TPA: flagellar basal body protein [Stellaceae bacterium]|jgi:flagellar hook protein FlgE|nr:flagellar basal body protein [Stellaceae bacterium]
MAMTDLSTISIAASALTAQSTQVNVIADNVANAETPDYTEQQAQFVPMHPGVSVSAVIDTGQPVDLATQMVNLINAQLAYQAAAETLRTADANAKTLIAAV